MTVPPSRVLNAAPSRRGAEAHVLQLHAFMDEACAAGHFEGHLEMQGLALIDEIQHAIGVQLLAAIAHGGRSVVA